MAKKCNRSVQEFSCSGVQRFDASKRKVVLWIRFCFNADPDSFSVNADPSLDPNPAPKFYSRKNPIFTSKMKNSNLFIIRPPWKTSKLHEKPSALKREPSALQKKKFITFLLFLWANFALLDPDQIWIRIRIQIHNTAFNFYFIYFYGSFLPSWTRIHALDLDPQL